MLPQRIALGHARRRSARTRLPEIANASSPSVSITGLPIPIRRMAMPERLARRRVAQVDAGIHGARPPARIRCSSRYGRRITPGESKPAAPPRVPDRAETNWPAISSRRARQFRDEPRANDLQHRQRAAWTRADSRRRRTERSPVRMPSRRAVAHAPQRASGSGGGANRCGISTTRAPAERARVPPAPRPGLCTTTARARSASRRSIG